MGWFKAIADRAQTIKNRRETKSQHFFAEPLECRALLSAAPFIFVSFANPADITSTASGTQLSLDVQITQLPPLVVQNAMTGTVSVEWWNGSAIDGQTKVGGKPIGTAPVAPDTTRPTGSAADANVAVTLNKSDAQAAGPLTNGAYLLVAVYAGGSGFPATGSSDAIAVTFSNSTVVSNSLAFLQNPTDAAAGQIIAPAVTVAIENSSGSVVTSSNDTVTLAVTGGSAKLSGTHTEIAVAGVATFADLSIADLGTFVLTATSGSDTPATSESFNISSGQLVFVNQPVDGLAGNALAPPVTVALEDSGGDVIASDSSATVELDLVDSTESITGNTATLLDGVATFNNLTVADPGQYQLQASDGVDASVTSNTFNLTGEQLVFIQQPANTDLNTPITLSVEIQNGASQVDTSATTSIQLSLDTLSGGTGAVLAGNLVAPFVNGIASFTAADGVALNAPGTYSLIASQVQAASLSDSTAVITSDPFVASPYQLVIIRQPAKSGDVNSPMLLTIALENSRHQIQKVDTNIVLQVTASSSSGATVQGSTPLTFVNGVAKLNVATALSISIPGSYSLSLSDPDLSAPVSTHPFSVKGLHLAARKLPGAVDLYTGIPLAVALLNSKNKLVKTEDTASVQLGFNSISGGAGAVLSGTTVAVFVNGIATFTAVAGASFNAPGTFTLSITDNDSTGSPSLVTAQLVSHSFKVLADHIAIKRQPLPIASPAQPLHLTFAIKDSRNRINTSASGYVAQLTLNTLTGGIGAALTGTLSIPFTNGLADFTDLMLSDAPGTFSFTVDATSDDPAAFALASVTSRNFKVVESRRF